MRYSPATDLDGAVFEQLLVQLADNDLGVSQFQVREATALSRIMPVCNIEGA